MRTFILFVFLIVTSNPLKAQWVLTGQRDFDDRYNTGMYCTVSPTGVPYAVYRDGSQKETLRVKKLKNNLWTDVGPSVISDGDIGTPSLFFDLAGKPYVAYSDGAYKWRATVKYFDGTTWKVIGKKGFTPGTASFTSIAIDNSGVPYIVFRDQGDTVYNSWPNGYKASVMKFNGIDWEYVGKPGFSLENGAKGALDLSLKIDNNGKMYVAFIDFSNDFKATVMTFNGTDWIYVGEPGFSKGQTSNISMCLDSSGLPYVAYWDREYQGKATVMKLIDNSWVPVGNPGVTLGTAEYTSLVLDKNNVPYLAFKDYANNKKVTVLKFDNQDWEPLGIQGFSEYEALDISLAIDHKNNILYVGYDAISPDGDKAATVMRYDLLVQNATGEEKLRFDAQLKLYPNPTNGIINIEANNIEPYQSISITLFNAISQNIFTELMEGSTTISTKIDLGSLPKGVYFLQSGALPDGIKTIRKIVLN